MKPIVIGKLGWVSVSLGGAKPAKIQDVSRIVWRAVERRQSLHRKWRRRSLPPCNQSLPVPP
jgi:hypothetical protein